jgi:hypothetical protein
MDSTDSIYKVESLQRISLVSDFPENRLLLTIYHRNDYDGGWWQETLLMKEHHTKERSLSMYHNTVYML